MTIEKQDMVKKAEVSLKIDDKAVIGHECIMQRWGRKVRRTHQRPQNA